MLLFSGSANRTLANKVAAALKIPLSNASIHRFSDGEYDIQVHTKVRNQDVYIIQPTSSPVNDNLIELCLLVNAIRRNGAKRITALVPYIGYSRQDFAACKAGTPYSMEVIVGILNSLGLDYLVTLDLHAAKTAELFACPVTNLSSLDIFTQDLRCKQHLKPIIVSPDLGGATRANKVAQLLQCDLVVMQKQRKYANTAITGISGNVKDRHCMLIDDIIDTGNTICNAANELNKHGAKAIYVYCTHAILSNYALQRLNAVKIAEIAITDSVELKSYNMYNNILKQFSIANLLADQVQKQRNGVQNML